MNAFVKYQIDITDAIFVKGSEDTLLLLVLRVRYVSL